MTEAMKFIVDREALQRALMLIGGVVKGRTIRAQLGCVLLVAEKGLLVAAATDGEVSLRVPIGAVDTLRPGSALIPLAQLSAAVGSMTATTVTIESVSDGIRASDDTSMFSIFGFAIGDYPPIPSFAEAANPTGSFACPVADLARSLRLTVFSMSKESTRYALAGLLIRHSGKAVDICSTDGQRLSLMQFRATAADGESIAIVPAKSATNMARILGDEDPEDDSKAEIARVGERMYLRTQSGVELATSLVEGTFPPYKEVIPKDGSIIVKVEREPMLAAIRSAMVMRKDEYTAAKLSFTAADKTLRINVRVPEKGEATVTCPIAEYVGADIEIGFKPWYFADLLSAMDTAVVEIGMSAPNRPALIKAGGYQHVIMSLKI